MGLLCVNHETGESRPSHSVRLLRVALDGVEIRSTFNPGVPATLETPGVSIDPRSEHRSRILPGTPRIPAFRGRRTRGERTESFPLDPSSLIETLRAPCIPACVPRARPQPTYADLSHITSSTHLRS